MIIDVHTRMWESSESLGEQILAQQRRIYSEPWHRPSASPSSHQEAMIKVDLAFVLGLESKLLGASIRNEKVADYLREHPGRFVGFASIDPAEGSITAQFNHAMDLDFKGITISPAGQGFHPSDSRLISLYGMCEESDLPIIIEPAGTLASSAVMAFARPHLIDEIARSFPGLKIIISGFGDPWVDETLALLAKHRQVYTDLSGLITRPWQLYNAMLQAHQRGVMHQIFFASDFPFCTPEAAIKTLYSVNTLVHGSNLPNVPREQLRSIVERDVIECLGLDVSITRREKPELPAQGEIVITESGMQPHKPETFSPVQNRGSES